MKDERKKMSRERDGEGIRVREMKRSVWHIPGLPTSESMLLALATFVCDKTDDRNEHTNRQVKQHSHDHIHNARA